MTARKGTIHYTDKNGNEATITSEIFQTTFEAEDGGAWIVDCTKINGTTYRVKQINYEPNCNEWNLGAMM